MYRTAVLQNQNPNTTSMEEENWDEQERDEEVSWSCNRLLNMWKRRIRRRGRIRKNIYTLKNITHIQNGPVHFMPNDIIIFACIRNSTVTHISHGMKCFEVLYLKSNHSSLHTPTPPKKPNVFIFIYYFFCSK